MQLETVQSTQRQASNNFLRFLPIGFKLEKDLKEGPCFYLKIHRKLMKKKGALLQGLGLLLENIDFSLDRSRIRGGLKRTFPSLAKTERHREIMWRIDRRGALRSTVGRWHLLFLGH